MIWFIIARFYAKLYSFALMYLHITLRGRKYLLRRVKRDQVLTVADQKLYFNHKVAACYMDLIAENYSEPPTHKFLASVINSINFDIQFFNVGANVGEMVIDVARYENVKSVIGFEPSAECVKACRLSACMNGYGKIEVRQQALNADGTPVTFLFNAASPAESCIDLHGGQSGLTMPASTLDKEISDRTGPAIILIDVEGAETLVLQGGKQYIEREKPLIIFEYNDVSRKSFSLTDVNRILGDGYKIFRLRSDAVLDQDFVDTWNCVAVNDQTDFYKACESFITTL